MFEQKHNGFYETDNFNSLMEIYHFTQKANQELQQRLAKIIDENQLLHDVLRSHNIKLK